MVIRLLGLWRLLSPARASNSKVLSTVEFGVYHFSGFYGGSTVIFVACI
jgi:hypothetical protein